MRVDDARDLGDAAAQILGDAQIPDAIVTDGAHVDRRGEPEIEDLGGHVGRLEIEQIGREGGRQYLPQLADIVCGRGMTVVERDHDHAVIDCDRRAVGERPVIGPRRNADIVDDQVEVLLRDDLTDLVLDRLKNLVGHLDAGARGRADMELDHAAIDRRVKIAADQDEHRRAERQHQNGEDRNDDPAGQQHCEQGDIALRKRSKPRSNPA